MATTELPDGRPVAVTGSEDATARIWDLTTSRRIGDPLTGHTAPVVAVATTELPDGRPVAVTGSEDRTARIWDLSTGQPTGEPLTGHTGPVYAVATTVLPDGRPVAVTGSRDHTVRIWDLHGRVPTQPPLRLPGPVAAIATLRLQTGIRIVVAGRGIIALELQHDVL